LLILLTISILTTEQGALIIRQPDVTSRLDFTIGNIEDFIRMNPENASDYRKLLFLTQQQRILANEREELTNQLESMMQEGKTILNRSHTFGFTSYSIFPFVTSIFLVFLGRIQWAGVSTAAGFIVMAAVLALFQYYQGGELSEVSEGSALIIEALNENLRQSDSILNQTEDIYAKIVGRG
jgi:hypothetical protein